MSNDMNNRLKVQSEIKDLKKEMVGCVYRHFKGNLYQVVDIVVHSETEEPLVSYISCDSNKYGWARPLENFLSDVDHEKYPDVTQGKRFEKISKNENEIYHDILAIVKDPTFAKSVIQTMQISGCTWQEIVQAMGFELN